MEPQIRFCSTTDGVRIAFGVTGDDSTPGILVPSLLSPTRLIAHDPVYRAMAEREAAALRRRMVFFDRRGTGLSERDVEDFRREVLVRDVEAVADHLRLPPALVVGIDSACAVAVEFAVRHPERVSHLVLFAPFRRGRDIGTAEGRDLVMSSLRNVENIGAELMSVFVVPGADPGFARRYATVLRESCTGRAAAAQLAATYDEDLTDILPRVGVPTLVLHSRGSRLIPLQLGREVASLIPNARFLALDYDNHLVWTQDPGAYVAAIAEFVGEKPAERPLARSAHGTAVILFADIVDSTGLTERLGDEPFRDRARALDEALRAAIRDAGGTPVEGKLLGDGVLAVFASAREALEAAVRCRDAGALAGLVLHLGVHAGDVIRERDNVYGGAVNVASRIAAAAAPSEVLVSETVRSLARTSAGMSFADRGEHRLKGVSEPVRLWAVADARDT